MIGTGEQATPYIISDWNELLLAAAADGGSADNLKYFKCDSGLTFDLDEIDPLGYGVTLNFGQYKNFDFNGTVIQNGRSKFVVNNSIWKSLIVTDTQAYSSHFIDTQSNGSCRFKNSKFKVFSGNQNFLNRTGSNSGRKNFFDNCEITFCASNHNTLFTNLEAEVHGCKLFIENAKTFSSSSSATTDIFYDCDIEFFNAITDQAGYHNCFITGSADSHSSGAATDTIFDLEISQKLVSSHTNCVYNSDKFIVPEGGTLPKISGATFLTTAQIHDPQSLWDAGILIPH